MPFDDLGLSPEILRAVAEEGYTEPTPIQREAIPIVLSGRDLMARAQTGTGKTAAFALPILERLKVHANTSFSPARHPIRVLVVAPTRELAIQVHDSFRVYGRHVGLRSTIVYGGVPMAPQERDLLAGVEIVVATPGPTARSRRQPHAQPRPGRGARARRGRPDARHGLHRRHPAHPRAAARAAPEPPLLGAP